MKPNATTRTMRGMVAETLLARLVEQARAHPHTIALQSRARTLDYAALFDSVARSAMALRTVGIRTGEVVALDAEREAGCITLILAILYAGGSCLPLDAGYPEARIEMMLTDARPRLLIAHEATRARWPVAVPWCGRNELATLTAEAAPTDAPVEAELTYVLFTSGSTGRPKGVAMRRKVLARLIDWHVAHPRLGAAARTLQFAPLSFDVSFQEILATLATGGTLVLPEESERRDPFALLALIERERIERVFLPYVALQALAEAVAAGGGVPASLRDVITAGEQLRITPAIRALFTAMPGRVLHNHYGPTETHVVTIYELAGDPAAWPELPPIGRPLPHVRVRVADAAMDPVAEGEEGELLLGGECLAEGYINRPDLTAERFVEHDGGRWYHTGDRVRMLPDGALVYLGRSDTQIKLDGYRIEPAEIEVVLSRNPAVAEAVVVATDGRLVAHIVPRDTRSDETGLVALLREHCKAQLANYLMPRQFVLHAALPLTASGKIDRRALARDSEQAPLAWPESATLQEQLRALWQQLLGIAELDVQVNLFDLGARSLTVVRALTELRRHGFRTLTAAQIYEYPSIAKLALLLGDSAAASGADAAQADTRGRNQRAALARFGPRAGQAS